MHCFVSKKNILLKIFRWEKTPSLTECLTESVTKGRPNQQSPIYITLHKISRQRREEGDPAGETQPGDFFRFP